MAEETIHWETKGFIAELARVCDNLEHLPEDHYLPNHLREVIEQISTATKVEDLDHLSDNDLNAHIGTIRHELPRYYQEIVATIRDVGRARAIVADDDFI